MHVINYRADFLIEANAQVNNLFVRKNRLRARDSGIEITFVSCNCHTPKKSGLNRSN